MSARELAPAKPHRGGNGAEDAAARQGEGASGPRSTPKIAKKDRTGAQNKAADTMQAGTRAKHPNTFPAQHLKSLGLEADLKLAPMYEAPGLQGLVASLRTWRPSRHEGANSAASGAPSPCSFAREGGGRCHCLSQRARVCGRVPRAVEAEGRRCILIPGDVAEPGFCAGAVKKTVAAFRQVYDILVMRPSGARRRHRRHQRRALRSDAQNQPVRLFYTWPAPSCHTPAPRQLHRDDGLGHGSSSAADSSTMP